MCEFCEKHLNGRILGKPIEVFPWAYKTDLKKVKIVTHPSTNNPCIVIRSVRTTRGSFEINYCPMCGRDLRSGINDKN